MQPLTKVPYLQRASRASLEALELSALNRAANIRREIKALVEEAIFETGRAEAARFILEHFDELRSLRKAQKGRGNSH